MVWNSSSRLCLRLVLFACFLSVTIAANAGSNVGVQLTGAGGSEYGLGSNYAYGEYLMPYYLSINSANPIAVICDDFDHTVTIGEQWTAAVSTFSNLSGTRFGVADSTQYHEAAWIASQINSNSSLANIAGAQFAIWALFSSDTPMEPGEQTWLNAAATAAAASYYGMNFSDVEILTPINPSSPQEYFFFIPEPSALVDLGMGLLAFAAIWSGRRRRLTSTSAAL
jgi:MYXO-CTERM domain-containing protein